jgi:hypothetical protein
MAEAKHVDASPAVRGRLLPNDEYTLATRFPGSSSYFSTADHIRFCVLAAWQMLDGMRALIFPREWDTAYRPRT